QLCNGYHSRRLSTFSVDSSSHVSSRPPPGQDTLRSQTRANQETPKHLAERRHQHTRKRRRSRTRRRFLLRIRKRKATLYFLHHHHNCQNGRGGTVSTQSIIAPRAPKSMVVGTIFGHRRGPTWLCFQHHRLDPKPSLLLRTLSPPNNSSKKCGSGWSDYPSNPTRLHVRSTRYPSGPSSATDVKSVLPGKERPRSRIA
ncbi:hypothetical protein RJ641_024703, partial [Dillenia turbinata]